MSVAIIHREALRSLLIFVALLVDLVMDEVDGLWLSEGGAGEAKGRVLAAESHFYRRLI
jgi:hypothetical protein